MNEYKLTVITRQFQIESENLSQPEKKLLQEILDNDFLEGLDIKVSSRRRQGFGYYFVDFVSTNCFTIQENINNYLNADNVEDLDLNLLIQEELKKVS